ncbi:hypothetical protein LWI29_023042 [Acer saccharum]|uniref:Glutaredoxin domain-containing protein n=1 Tax=Acer saccharum TaxID=4024 RepID=A0AA39VN25_ACESA|nr:hypothetical protein LWI29_023042 [Acer saccharum]
MKGVKGRLLKKLNFVPTINSLKQGLPLHLNSSQKLPIYKSQSLSIYRDHEDHTSDNIREIVLGNIGVSGDHKVTKDLKDDQEMELELEFHVAGDKEKFTTSLESKNTEEYPCLTDFGDKCPPGGENSVIFYTTSLRGIRKTFEDCSSVRFLLQSFKVAFDERDISLHLEFRDELWRLLGGRVIPPKLFIKGRYIGGADEVVGLHEQGNLKKLLEGIPPSLSNCPCNGCANIRFVVCFNCHGSCKVFKDGDIDNDEILYVRCPDCNENGLVKCPICC